MSCDTCAQCHLVFGFSERDIVAFSNGKCTHGGNCAAEYRKRQVKNKGLKIVSYDLKASQGLVTIESVSPIGQVSAPG